MSSNRSANYSSPSSAATSSTAASTNQHKPRQFQFKKNHHQQGPCQQPNPEGEPSEFKTSLLGHWNEWVSDYDRRNALVIDSIADEHPLLWRRAPKNPVFMEPLGPTEIKAFATGQFQAVYPRYPPGKRALARGGERTGGELPETQRRQPKKNYASAPSSHAQNAWRIDDHAEPDEDAEAEEILWSTEEKGVGMFDSEGHFKFISDSVMKSDVAGVKSPLNKSVLFGTPPSSSNTLSNTGNHQTNVEWFYKDPKGVTQGPFSSTQMFDWYSQGYFPESLPLRTRDDLNYESLAVWKIRRGRCPFEPTAAPGFSGAVSPTYPASKIEDIKFGTISSGDDPIVNVPVRKTVKPAQPVDQVEEQRRFLEGLMLSKREAKNPTLPLQQEIVAQQAQDLPAKYSAKSFAPQEPKSPWKGGVGSAAGASTSLSDIQKQQQLESSQVKPQQPVSVSPRSFADLLAAGKEAPRSRLAVYSDQKTHTNAMPQPPSVRDKPITTNRSSSQEMPKPVSAPKDDQLREWVIAKLKPVEKQIDSILIHSLLSECRTPEEAAALLRDNLITSPIASASRGIDLRSFGKDYLRRRFGKGVSTAAIEVVCPKPVDNRDERDEGEFLMVSRKGRK